jgi:hypothetical protein
MKKKRGVIEKWAWVRADNLWALYQLKTRGMLYGYGWWKSRRDRRPVDFNENPMPWLTYPFIEFIEPRVNKSFHIFEYGSGNSTLWWAARVGSVTACEHDREWYEEVSQKIPDNVTLLNVELEYGGEYSKQIAKYQDQFDLIVIDGRDRVNCAKNCLEALKEDGVIVWDNTERGEYEAGLKYLANNGFKRLDLWGVGPINVERFCTTVLYKRDSCIGL